MSPASRAPSPGGGVISPLPGRPGPIAATIFAAVLALSTAPSAGAPIETLDETALADALRTIQNTCFAAYPADLLKAMTGLEGPVPEEVRRDPRRQIDYLKSEAVVAKGLFYPSLLDDLVPALRAAVRPGARLLDLGSGDGRVVFLASLLGAHATGIEYDRALHRIAVDARGRLEGLIDPERADLRRGDFFKVDYSGYDVLYYYLSGAYAERRLTLKIAVELRPDAVLLVLAGAPEHFPELEPGPAYGPVRAFRRRAP